MKILSKIIVFMFVFAFLSEIAKAIPAFARKYKMSCQTCHAPVPRLKAYGDEFAGNGFKFPDKEASRFFMDTGDEDLSLIRNFPMAARFDAHMTLNNANSENSDFGVPYILKLLSGGELTEDIAYYFYFYMSERGEVVGVEDAYIMFNDLFGIDLDLYFGQFQVSDPLFKRELRLTLEDYQVYKTKPGLSKMNMAYDRGIMLTYGMEWGTDIILEVVNGCGLNPADHDTKLFDIDGNKTIVGRLSQDIGDFLRIGGFYMQGDEDLRNDQSILETNSMMAFGPDVTLGFGDMLELNVQYLQRKDENLYLTMDAAAPTESIETKGAMAELIFTPYGDKSDWYAVGVFNWIDSDADLLDYQAATFHLGYLLKRNIRLCLEGTYDMSVSGNEFGKVSLGVVTGF